MITLDRQSGIIPTKLIRKTRISIIGAGAIGSHTAECASKVGIPSIEIWDFDKVEEHNLSNQGYRLCDIGKMKTAALKERLEANTGVSILTRNKKMMEGEVFDLPIVISAVDSMQSRGFVWNNVKSSPKVLFFIDARMGAMFGQIFVADMTCLDSIKAYQDTLFDDSEAYQAPCTEKSTIFCALGMSAWIVAIIVDCVMNQTPARKMDLDFANKVAVCA